MIPERLTPGTIEWQVLEAEHRQRYEYFSPQYRGLSVLDIACGVGYGSQVLAQRGAAQVTGVDISKEAVEYARTHFSHANVKFLGGDATHLGQLGKCFDAAVSFETIEHLSNPADLIREVHGVLKPGGLFVCSTPNRDYRRRGAAKNPYHMCEWSYQQFHDGFSRYFAMESQYHQSPSPVYLRHLELLSELSGIHKQLRFSLAFRTEAMLRRAFGKEPVNGHSLPEALWRITPGDYVIEPVSEPSADHLVYIFVGRARNLADQHS